MSYDAIIFDLGGVLIDIDYSMTEHAFADLGASANQLLYSQAMQSDLFDAFETGRISSQQFINKIKDFLPARVTPNEVVSAWNAMILHFQPQKLDLLESLSRHTPLYLLSNTNDIHMEKVRRRLAVHTNRPLEHYFQKVYLSQEIGRRKPDSETFSFGCADAGILPERTLFIDDSEQHIRGAKHIGLQTVLFPQNQSLDRVFS